MYDEGLIPKTRAAAECRTQPTAEWPSELERLQSLPKWAGHVTGYAADSLRVPKGSQRDATFR
jgi:hypothetical protein